MDEILKKQVANAPLAPKFMHDVYAQTNKAEIPEEKPLEDEQMMTQLSQSPEWKVLRRYMRHKMDVLLDLTRASARQSADPAETGIRFFVYDQLSAFGEDVISYVERAAKAKEASAMLKSNLEVD